MRTKRLSLAGSVILGLLASLSLVVVAQQDGQGPPTATYVTGVAVPTAAGEITAPVGDGDLAWEMDWSDPRLPSHMVGRFNVDAAPGIHPAGSGVTVRMTVAVRLEGPEGAWSGTGDILAWTMVPESGEGPEEPRTEVQMLVLEGEGAYEGLSITLVGTGDEEKPSFEGFIFESPLSMPDPIEAVTR